MLQTGERGAMSIYKASEKSQWSNHSFSITYLRNLRFSIDFFFFFAVVFISEETFL